MANFDKNSTYSQRYKQTVVQFFDQRDRYDTERTVGRALPLLDLVELQPGQRVLDMATGTGIIAIAAAQRIGKTGQVAGVDFSAGMLAQAKQKIAELKLENVDLLEADAETVLFKANSFDAVFCSSALVYWTDIPTALKRWHQWLKPAGTIAFSAWSEKSHLTPLIIEICAQRGVYLRNINEPTGTAEKCRQLLKVAGFEQVKVCSNQQGHYMSVEQAMQWKGDWFHPKQNALELLSPRALKDLIKEVSVVMKERATKQGVWIEQTPFYVSGKKPVA